MTIPACLADGRAVALPAGAVIFRPGDACETFYFLTAGSVRVDLVGAGGRSVLLYRFGAGETCVMTTSCLMGGDDYSAEARAETQARALALPKAVFAHRLDVDPEMRALVFNGLARRLGFMMAKVEEVAFASIDRRLARRLAALADADGVVPATHERLAADLGTAREVVSRKLADWAARGLVERRRGGVRLVDARAIEAMAAAADDA